VGQHAHEWEEPIRLTHAQTGASRIFTQSERVILANPEKDVATILFSDTSLGLPTKPLGLTAADMRIREAIPVGWLGYPASITNKLCFFKGVISCFLDDEESYLVDGVAINGVSGGPAFMTFGQSVEAISLIGLVTAYVPNRSAVEVLPGLLRH
jgi:hypothetical protein